MTVPSAIAIPLLMLSTFGLAACRENNSSTTDSEHRFAVIYSNVAWQHKQIGFVINTTGELFWFDTTAAMREPLSANDIYPAETLNHWFPNNTSYLERLTTSQRDLLSQNAPLIVDGPLTDAQNLCADAGLYQYFYFHPLPDHRHKAILVYQTGDWRRVNGANASTDVKNLLIDKALQYQIAFRLFPGEDNWCTGM
jgi:hypothetical protein